MKIKIEWKPQDCWIGAYWEKRCEVEITTEPYCAPDGSTQYANVPRGRIGLHIWICVLPMLPFHITVPR